MDIVFLDGYSVGDIDLSSLRALGNLIVYDFTSSEEIIDRCKNAEIIVTNKVKLSEKEIKQLPKLQLICVAATGTNNIDIEFARKNGIIVKNVVDYSTNSVAECTFMFALALSHQLLYYDQFIKSKHYSFSNRTFHLSRPFSEMKNKTWGIIGLGNIGHHVASIASKFGCNVYYYSTSGKNRDINYPSVSLNDLLSISDIISIHAPLNPQTQNLITIRELHLMKKSAFIINVARGGIINENDLAFALNENMIAGAAIDVFEQEPLTAENPLLKIKDPTKLLLTPHLAWASIEARKKLIQSVAQNIISYIKEKYS